MVILLASRILGLGREAIIAALFGAAAATDAFFAAFRIPDILYNSFLTFLVGTSVIPVLSRYWVDGRLDAAGRYWSSVVTWGVLALLPVVLVGFIFAHELLGWLAPGLAADSTIKAVELTRVMLPILVFGWMTGAAKAALESRGRYLTPAFAPLIYNCCLILAALSLGSRLGISALAIGVLAAAVAQVGYQLPALSRVGLRYQPSLAGEPAALHHTWRLLYPTLIALLLGNIVPAVEVHLASQAIPGALSYMNYANRLFLLPEQIFSTGLSTVLFPLFAAAHASGDRDGMAHRLGQGVRLTVLVMAPISVLMGLFSGPVVSLLLERGAFDGTAVSGTSRALSAYSIGLAALCVKHLVVFAFFALHDARTLMWVTTAMTVVNVGLDVVMFSWLSYAGLALGMALTTCLHAVLLIVLLRRRLEGGGTWGVSELLPKVAAGAALVGLLAWTAAPHVPAAGAGSSAVQRLAILIAVGAGTSIVYIAAMWAWRVPEARDLIARSRLSPWRIFS